MGTLLLIGFGVFLMWAYSQAGTAPKRRRPKPKPSAPRPSEPPPHEVLGVAADASPETIRRAYQDKIRQYHPDRVAGAAPELQRLAEQRTKELNRAFAALTRGSS